MNQTAERAKLKQLHENGILNDEMYASLIAQLDLVAHPPATDPNPPPSHTGGSVNSGYLTAGGDFAGRDMVKHIVHLYQNAPGTPLLNEEEFTKAIGRYLDWVARNLGRLDLRGLQPRERQVPELTLDDVYVSLSASLPHKHRAPSRRSSESESIDPDQERAEQLVNMNQLFPQQPRLAIIGGPGSGKTTYLKLIAATIARALLTGDTQAVQEWLGLQGQLPLPIYISLSQYNLYRREKKGTLVNYLSHSLIENNIVSGLPSDFFARLLLEGRACCLLLDGLDEIAHEPERWQTSSDIEALSDNSGIPYLVVTSRTRAYVGRTRLPFQAATVQPMQAEQVQALVSRWCRAVYPVGQVAEETADLQAEIEQLEAHRHQRGQPALIETPLLVTLVAIVHFDQRRLPQQRAELYQKCVNVLLAEKHKPGRQVFVELADWGGNESEKRSLLAELAYKMMTDGAGTQKEAGRQVARAQIEQWLRPIYERDYTAKEAQHRLDTFLQAMVMRNSLLNERGGQYEFIHLTFQEYLCAYYLAEVKRDVTQIADFLLAEGRVNQAWWRETILLTIGYLGLNSKEGALQLVQKLATGEQKGCENSLAATEVAAAGFLELESHDKETIACLQTSLQTHLADKELTAPPALRLLAGDALGSVGDNRRGVLTLEPDWVPVAAGVFLMGEKKHTIEIATPYAISRYPVTNAQYSRFVTDGGYSEKWRDCWTEEGWQYRMGNNWQEPRHWDNIKWNRPNQPVVGVSWYEALAFCGWLTRRLRQEGRITSGQSIGLPTEAEWERAARHTDGRIYPWGNTWREGVANSKEAGLERSTAVGIFPHNHSAAGVLDMAGNVWEWCQTRWRDEDGKDYPSRYNSEDGREQLSGGGTVRRVLKGGSYYNSNTTLVCASRLRHPPYYRSDNYGFRVCVRPFFP